MCHTFTFQAEIKTSFVYLVLLCTLVNLVNCLLSFFTLLYHARIRDF